MENNHQPGNFLPVLCCAFRGNISLGCSLLIPSTGSCLSELENGGTTWTCQCIPLPTPPQFHLFPMLGTGWGCVGRKCHLFDSSAQNCALERRRIEPLSAGPKGRGGELGAHSRLSDLTQLWCTFASCLCNFKGSSFCWPYVHVWIVMHLKLVL